MTLCTVLALAGSAVADSSPPSNKAPPPAAAPARRVVKTRKDLSGWMLPLPKRGLFWWAGGLGGSTAVVIDRDTRKLTTRVDLIEKDKVKPVAKTLAPAEVDRLWKLAEAAWAAPPPKHESVTDYAEVVVALDGDDVMIISVNGPMPTTEPASQLALALRKSAGPDW